MRRFKSAAISASISMSVSLDRGSKRIVRALMRPSLSRLALTFTRIPFLKLDAATGSRRWFSNSVFS